MNLLRELTIKNLKINKRRSIITTIGIILSVALMVTVTTMVSSLKATMRNAIISENGNYHIKIINGNDYVDKIKNNKDVDSYLINHELGYANINSKEDYKPYLKVIAMDKDNFSKNELKIIKGKFPENSNEIVVGENIKTVSKVDLAIGQKLNLAVSDRVTKEGEAATEYIPEMEHLQEKFKKEYTVVGIIKRANRGMEDYTDPGVSAITLPDSENVQHSKQNIFYRIKRNVNIEEHLHENYGDDTSNLVINYRLMQTEGFETDDDIVNMLYILSVILLVIILLTSIVVIKNSFSISIVEKTKQYGILKSLGASNSQIKRDIYFEGFVLGSIGIILGIALGIIVNKILIVVMNTYLKDILQDIKFVSSISILGIVIAAVTSMLSIFISLFLIARRVRKFSAIESIRSTKDIVIKRKIKTPKFIESLFGVSGLISHKNFKRDKKRYRTTTISITLIVIIFIGLFSATSYLRKTLDIEFGSVNFNIEHTTFSSNKNQLDKDVEISKKIVNEVLEDEKSLMTKSTAVLIDSKYLDDNIQSSYEKEGTYARLNLLDDDTFDKLLKENNLGKENTHLVINKHKMEDENNKTTEFKTFKDLNIDIHLNDNLVEELYGENEENSSLDTFKKEKENIKLTEINKPVMGFQKYNTNYEINIFARESDYANKVFIDRFSLFIQSNDDRKTQENIEKFVESEDTTFYINNITELIRRINNAIFILNIFSYGFIIVISLIALTSTFNTITSNMILRKREFATLRSIGITNKDIKNMIKLESIFLGLKSLIFGIPIGLAISYLIYTVIKNNVVFEYYLPITSIAISIIIVFSILYMIMSFAVSKVDKLNIVETIKNENV
ncbi:ABC transporter permease [Helcococcus kunzii]|uniref:ABC transporter permease n=1 Tax=Helcococcus kunzii TaxID=40091 RepID=UPI0038AA86C2